MTSPRSARPRGVVTAATLALGAMALLLWAGTALAAGTPSDPAAPATTTVVPDTTTSVPDTTPTTQPPPPTTQPPPPPATTPAPRPAPAPTAPSPAAPSPRRPGAARVLPPTATVTGTVAPPPASPPVAASVAPPVVLSKTLAVPDSVAVFALAGTTRSTLPPDFDQVQPVAAFVPPTGFSPSDVLVLALAALAGFGLVFWEVVEESQWST